MKNTFFFLLWFTCGFIKAQSFEGTLTYVSSVEVSPSLLQMGMTKAALLDNMRTEGVWADTVWTTYDKKGDYRTLLANKAGSYFIYKAGANKLYTMGEGATSETCTVLDVSKDLEEETTGKLPSISQMDTTVMVNGTACKVVCVKWKMGTYYYYYNAGQLAEDASLFSKHIYDGWAGFLAISHALPLRIVKTVNGMATITFTLVAAKSEAVNESLFSIPKLTADKGLNLIKTGNREVMRIKK